MLTWCLLVMLEWFWQVEKCWNVILFYWILELDMCKYYFLMSATPMVHCHDNVTLPWHRRTRLQISLMIPPPIWHDSFCSCLAPVSGVLTTAVLCWCGRGLVWFCRCRRSIEWMTELAATAVYILHIHDFMYRVVGQNTFIYLQFTRWWRPCSGGWWGPWPSGCGARPSRAGRAARGRRRSPAAGGGEVTCADRLDLGGWQFKLLHWRQHATLLAVGHRCFSY